jgi:hypothetical protein
MACRRGYGYLEWKREKKVLLEEWEGLKRDVRRE